MSMPGGPEGEPFERTREGDTVVASGCAHGESFVSERERGLIAAQGRPPCTSFERQRDGRRTIAPDRLEQASFPRPRQSSRASAALTRLRGLLLAAAVIALAACASRPPAPDWQPAARGAIDRGLAAYLKGETRIAEAEFATAQRELARTGRADLLARAALIRCAAQVASLAFGPCAAFEALRADAAAPERAYADYLTGTVQAADIALLPLQHRAAASAALAQADAADSALAGIEDPLARLVAAGVLFQRGRASPAAIALAAQTASAQGWRRPLLAWLKLQLALAERAGAEAEAARLRRQIDIVQEAR